MPKDASIAAKSSVRHWLVWNVFFRLHELAKGHDTYKILAEMEAAERLSPDQLAEFCAGKLRAFVHYCYQHVPYVREQMRAAGVDPSRIRYPEDLALLPVMTKEDIRRHRKSLRSEVAGRLTPFSTGGSTGEPLLFDLSKRRIASRVACRQRVSRWWGVSVGVPEVALWGAPIELTRQDWIRAIRDRVLATQLFSAFEMTDQVMTSYLDRMERMGCRQLFGYPSSIYLLCLHARNTNRDLRKLKIQAAFVTGEVLLPQQRELIETVLGCPAADGYGGRDSGFIAHECPQGGMHVISDAVVVEILDSEGRRLPPGKLGQIVATDLYSEEAPFLRYATGDMGALSGKSCSCGRPLPLLERIDGRATDFVVAPDGRILHALSLIYILREIEGVAQFKIVQEKLDSFLVQIVRNSNYRTEEEARIRETLSRRMRCAVQVRIEYKSELARERSGKFRHVVSALPPEEVLRLAHAGSALAASFAGASSDREA